MLLAACSNNEVSTKIKANTDSENSTTFDELKIWKILDFGFQMQEIPLLG